MTFYIHEDLIAHFNTDKSLFDQLMTLRGEVFRHQEGRKTQRVKIGDHYYFIKQHRGVGYLEILKNWLQGKAPVVSAKNEWRAIHLLHRLGLAAPPLYGYGERGWNPAQRQSFVLLGEVESESLEQITANWQASPPTIKRKRTLIREVARIAKIMHEHGMNHRDFYLCHFLERKSDQQLCLLDMHRAQLRAETPLRWRIKDLAGLYFSSKDIGLTPRDYLRFIAIYSGTSAAKALRKEKEFWQAVMQRGEKLYRDHHRK